MLYEPTLAECVSDDAELLQCDCSDPPEYFAGDECPNCARLAWDAVECRTCGENWILEDGERECPECRESARVGRDVVAIIGRALAAGKAVHIEPRERHDGARTGPFPARCVWVGGAAIVYGEDSGQGWPQALRMAAGRRGGA